MVYGVKYACKYTESLLIPNFCFLEKCNDAYAKRYFDRVVIYQWYLVFCFRTIHIFNTIFCLLGNLQQYGSPVKLGGFLQVVPLPLD